MLLEMHSGAISFVTTLFRAHQLFNYFLCSLQWRQLHVKLPNSLINCDTVVFGVYVCALATPLMLVMLNCPFGTWRRLIRPLDLGLAVSLAAPPLRLLTVPLLISRLRISSSSSSGLYCDDMPCALYHMLFAVVKGGRPYLVMFKYAQGKACF